MLVHGFVPVSRANGPGRRAVLWFQGCTLNCPGCFNQASHSFEGAPADDDDASDIIRRVLALHHAGGIEGLTFSGGEPMQQASSVLELIGRLREAGATPLSVGMFTGYTLHEMERGRYFTFEDCRDKVETWRLIRAGLDFAVMGRYNQLESSALPLRSSRNQRLHLFTTRYQQGDFAEPIVEVSIEQDGLTTITGFPILGIPA
jgi:anaerobic ribonucleoside-triphosphate reductase activating protein